jgi:hypothetical protein
VDDNYLTDGDDILEGCSAKLCERPRAKNAKGEFPITDVVLVLVKLSPWQKQSLGSAFGLDIDVSNEISTQCEQTSQLVFTTRLKSTRGLNCYALRRTRHAENGIGAVAGVPVAGCNC